MQPLDHAALHALRESGARPIAAYTYGLVPRALPDLLSYAFYRFECSIRAAAVLGLIGAGGLGFQLLLSLQSLRYRLTKERRGTKVDIEHRLPMLLRKFAQR